jgi:hypothetical protein
MAPQLGSIVSTMTWVFASAGDTAAMRAAAERSFATASGNQAGSKAFLALASHDQRTLAKVLSEIDKRPESGAMFMAGGYALLHNADSAIAWIDRAYAVNGDVIGNIQFPVFDWLRNDPRYVAVAKKYDIHTSGR